MSNSYNSSSSGAAAGGCLIITVIQVVLIMFKLFDVIDWPWIWVLLPLWGSIALCIGFFVLFAIILLVAKLITRN